MKKVIILLLFLVLMVTLVRQSSSFTETSIDDIINYKQTSSDLTFKQHIRKIDNLESDITLEPVGCFSSVFENFFLRKINPFNNLKEFDSGITITRKNLSSDFQKVLMSVKSNGFPDFARSFERKYSANYSQVPLRQLGALALFAGYSYLTVSKFNEKEINEIYMTYSPPMDKHNITGNFTDEEYQKNLTKSTIPMNTCGYSCGDGSKYMCGSLSYPNIKSASLYAVYKIVENV